MARKKKKVLTLDDIADIDVTTIPFQSRTTLGQYVLEVLQERAKRAKNEKENCPCQITLSMRELSHTHRIVV